MRLAMQLTLDGLVRTLRRSADRLAEEIEREGPERAGLPLARSGGPRETGRLEDDDERTRP